MYHLPKHTRCIIYNDTAIFLDVGKDEYILLDISDDGCLGDVLAWLPFSSLDHRTRNIADTQQTYTDALCRLIEAGLVVNTVESGYESRHKVERVYSAGANNVDWNIEPESIFGKTKIKSSDFILAYWTLAVVHAKLWFSGYYGAIKYLRKQSDQALSASYFTPKIQVDQVIKAINLAAFYFPRRVKCFEWSLALTLILSKMKYNAQLVVGVQNNPFISHAWVEIDNQVIADDESLKEYLGVILREPLQS